MTSSSSSLVDAELRSVVLVLSRRHAERKLPVDHCGYYLEATEADAEQK